MQRPRRWRLNSKAFGPRVFKFLLAFHGPGSRLCVRLIAPRTHHESERNEARVGGLVSDSGPARSGRSGDRSACLPSLVH